VEWLQHTAPGALPQFRVGQAHPHHDGVTKGTAQKPSRTDSALFSGSREAEQRAREFEGAGVAGGNGNGERRHPDEMPRGYDGA
jgi:hypothetical protein